MGKLQDIAMGTEVKSLPKDCLACRIVGAAGLIGIGGYIANHAWKNKTFAGSIEKVILEQFWLFGLYGSTATGYRPPPSEWLLLFYNNAFIVLGVSRYKQTYPFNKKEEQR